MIRRRGIDQFFAVIACECKLHWRQRGLRVVLIGTALVMLGLGAVSRSVMGDWSSFTMEERRFDSTQALMTLGPVAWCMLVIMVPPVLADTIPRDRQLNVRELLDSLPLSIGSYLAGKVVGAWTSLLLGWLGFGVGVGLAWLPILGRFDLGQYLDIWLVGLLPFTLYAVAVSVLLPAGQPTRRRAVLVGGCFLIFSALTVTNLYAPLVSTWYTPLCPGTWLYVMADKQITARNMSLMGAFPGLMPSLLMAAALQVGLLWTAVWVWMKREVER